MRKSWKFHLKPLYFGQFRIYYGTLRAIQIYIPENPIPGTTDKYIFTSKCVGSTWYLILLACFIKKF